jgi:hypothetical protein
MHGEADVWNDCGMWQKGRFWKAVSSWNKRSSTSCLPELPPTTIRELRKQLGPNEKMLMPSFFGNYLVVQPFTGACLLPSSSINVCHFLQETCMQVSLSSWFMIKRPNDKEAAIRKPNIITSQDCT